MAERKTFWRMSYRRNISLIAWYKSKKIKRCLSWIHMDLGESIINQRCERILGHRGDHAVAITCWSEGNKNVDTVSANILLDWETYGDLRKRTKRRPRRGRRMGR